MKAPLLKFSSDDSSLVKLWVIQKIHSFHDSIRGEMLALKITRDAYDDECDNIEIFDMFCQSARENNKQQMFGFINLGGHNLCVYGNHAKYYFTKTGKKEIMRFMIPNTHIATNSETTENRNCNPYFETIVRKRPKYMNVPLLEPNDTTYIKSLYNALKFHHPKDMSPHSGVAVALKAWCNKLEKTYMMHTGYIDFHSGLILEPLEPNDKLMGCFTYKGVRFFVFGKAAMKYFHISQPRRFIRIREIGAQERAGIFDGGIIWSDLIPLSNGFSFPDFDED